MPDVIEPETEERGMNGAASEFVRMNKPREIEEFLDTYLIRPMGFVLVQLLRNTAVTPNMVSAASVLAGIGAGICYADRSWEGVIGGLGFLLLSSALDSADGQLARATGRKTQLGRLFDGFCDNLAFTAMYVGILVAYSSSVGLYVPLVVAMALAAGFSHSMQSALTDYVRVLFLYYCFGSNEPAEEQPEVLRLRLREMRERRESILERMLLNLHVNYANKQRWLLPSSDALQREHQALTATRPELREAFGWRYREANTRLVRWWAVLASNSHKVAIVLTSPLPLLFESGFLHDAGMVLFFGYELVLLNLAMLALLHRQRTVDAALQTALRELSGPK